MEEQVAEPVALKRLAISVSVVEKLNLADFQNAVPLLKKLCLQNNTEDVLSELELSIESSPPFLKTKVWRLALLAKGQDFQIPDLDIQLDGALLTRLTEAETAAVTFVLRRRESQEELARSTNSIELLPRNQWGGLSHMPDLVAAFVQPNAPAIDRLLKQAADILRKKGKQTALDGYKGGPKRAWELTSAIWSAVSALGLDYALPPASFEHSGQKVRSAGQMMDAGLATCLDLALLFCSAMEQAGLNPLLVFTKGHAFAGVWLKPSEFSTTVVDDITALRKRLKLNEMVVFETTLTTQRPSASFSYASTHAAEQLSEEREESFELAVDIRRARMQRIKPLASAEAHVAEAIDELKPAQEAEFEDSPEHLGEEVEAPEDPRTLDPKDRLARWQRKLLDLSLRNNLLNFRAGKKTLKLEAPDPGALEDLLAAGSAIKVLPRPDFMDGADPRDRAVYESREREDVRRAHALDALAKSEVFVGVAQEELETRLVELYRTARTTMQEGGANTLYLALGFLSWTREQTTGTKYRAPLILIPVTLNRKSARSGFTLTLHEDEPRFNPTLIEMLRQDFKLDLGVAEGELPKDESGLDISAIWKSVSRAVKDVKGWEVSEEVVLAMFSFAKYLMWKDLTERTDQLRANPVVRHLIDTPRDNYPSSVAFPNPRHLDQELAPEKTFCPLPADSSQLSAVLAAVRGKDFVLIGPPGTGKSQTIANLIAQCLAEGKRVLFVSEKIAALDVVYRRLREVGLGEFCLELHSSKARKLDVLAQLQKAWEAQGLIDADVWQAEAQRLKRLRDELNRYVERLHHRHPNGMTVYEAIGRVVDGDSVARLPLAWSSAEAHGTAAMEAMRDIVDRLEVNAKAVGHAALQSHPLAAVGQCDWSPTWQQSLVVAAQSAVVASEAVEKAAHHFVHVTGLPTVPLTRRARGAIGVLARALPQVAGRDWRFVLRADAKSIGERLQNGVEALSKHRELTASLTPGWTDSVVAACRGGMKLLDERRTEFAHLGVPWPQEAVVELRRGLGLLDKIGQTQAALSVKYADGIEQVNVVQLQRELSKAEKAIWPMSWLGKRKVKAALDAHVAGEGQPDVAKDIRALVKIRSLRSEVQAADIGAIGDGVWRGLKTKPEVALSALEFQRALQAARNESQWKDAGFEAIAGGRCGADLQDELARMRALRALDEQINTLNSVAAVTDNVWAGRRTDVGMLNAALAFNTASRAVAVEGALKGEHEVVASGKCGANMQADHERLKTRGTIERQLIELDDLRQVTGGLWNGLRTRVEEVEGALKFQSAMATAVSNLATTPEDISAAKTALERLIGDGNALLEPTGQIAGYGRAYVEVWGALQSAIDRVATTAQFSAPDKAEFGEAPLSHVKQQCRDVLQLEAKLHAWCAWRKARAEAVSLSLELLAEGLESGAIGAGDTRRTFEANYSRWWLNAVVDSEPVIRTFVSAEHEKRVGDFRALEHRFTELTRAWVRASMCADLPKQDSVTRNSEWGILRHEMTKKKQHLPLRELMTSIPTALTKLTPCLLMSPLSIAQYLAADATTFDLVVFDEASQIPVWDAIGAIARGRQVVMVGDPKQLPPTNFFDRADSSDDDNTDGDLESILDECMGANLPTMNLAWHYRSRHESLIAFSNHRYYGGSLVTFPSPVTNDRAVSFHHVEGVYEKGGARINKPEAKALVADLVGRLKSPEFRASKLTVGVVTFNGEQQRLIEDLLDDARREDPSLESYFAEVELEPVFVKNLESVQGDERDIMYFSITYGPDIGGAVSMNFGPMNRDGGERRLNVAITRARHELRVFSSLKAEKMDLNRTQARGVRDLKHFLEFAERGTVALAEATSGSLGEFESPFEEAVATALTSKGWELQTQIGASSFRVDLAVVHPDAKGIYLTGIECDGATYHRSATARDRDMLREQVLRGLGWEILRVWSTDFWIDRAGTLDRLDAKLRALLEASRKIRAKNAELELARQEAAAAIAKAKDELPAAPLADPVTTSRPVAVDGVPSGLATPLGPVAADSERSEQEVFARNASMDGGPGRAAFIEADPATVVDSVKPDAFFERSYDAPLSKMIAHVVETEGPVLDAVLARRIARAHGWQRTGSRIQERVLSLATSFLTTKEEVGAFYWASGRGPDVPVTFRRGPDESSRTVDEICMPELVALAREVLTTGRTGEAAIVAMARDLGLQRLRAASRGRFEAAIAKAGTLE